MWKIIVCFTVFLTPCNVGLAQYYDIGKFVNDIVKAKIPDSLQYFNLVDLSFTMRTPSMNSDHLEFFNPELASVIKENPDLNLNLIIDKIAESEIINWRDYNIEKARIYSFDSIPKFATHIRMITIIPYKSSPEWIDSLESNKKYNEIIVPARRCWTKRRINKEIELKWKQREESFSTEDRKYYMISTPVFSDDRKYALVQFIYGGEGSTTYLFIKGNGAWSKNIAIDGYVY